MLEKIPLNHRDVQVTFRMPPMDGVVELYLCGEFNNWHTAGAPLSLEPDGSWVTTLVLQSGRSYRFRYLDNQGRYHNDWDADAYVPNDFGTEDSVLDLTAVKAPPSTETRASAPKTAAGGASARGARKAAGDVSDRGATKAAPKKEGQKTAAPTTAAKKSMAVAPKAMAAKKGEASKAMAPKRGEARKVEPKKTEPKRAPSKKGQAEAK